jgi:hypothetical protein
VKTWPTSGASPDARYDAYVPRLAQSIAATLKAEAPAASAAKKKKKNKE